MIVTARKREETLLDIPQEIQAISQEQLERANLDSVEDFSRFVPSLSYNAMTPGRGTIYFRGVADDSSSFIADASSAIYLDEQPLTQSALQPEIRLVDIERIEALPGPQGTLYGSSSQSGTLRYITNKPDPTRLLRRTSALDGHSVDHGDEGYEVSGVAQPAARRQRRDPRRRLLGARRRFHRQRARRRASAATFDNADFVDEDINGVEYLGGRAALRWTAERELDRGRAASSTSRWTRTATRKTTSGARGRELAVVRFLDESRERRMDAARADAPGRPRLRPVHLGDQLFHAPDRLLPGQHGLHVLPEPRVRRELRATTTSARIRSASAGATARTSTASRRNSGSRARPRRLTWLAGLFYEKVEEGYSFFTRIEDYEDTPSRSNYWNYLLRRGARHDRQRLLPLEERPEDRTISRLSAKLATRRTRTGRSPPACAGSTTRARATTSSSSRTATSPRTSARPRNRPATSRRSSPCSTTSTTTRWCTRSTPTASAPAARNVVAPRRLSLPADYDAGLPRQLRARLQEPACRAASTRLNLTAVQDGVGRLPGRGRRPGPAVCHAGRQRRRRRDRGRLAWTSARSSGTRSTSG